MCTDLFAYVSLVAPTALRRSDAGVTKHTQPRGEHSLLLHERGSERGRAVLACLRCHRSRTDTFTFLPPHPSSAHDTVMLTLWFVFLLALNSTIACGVARGVSGIAA